MENYRKKLKNQNTLLIFIILAASCLGILGRHVQNSGLTSPADDFRQGFVLGLTIASELCALILLVRNTRALGDEQKLKALYIKENDERSREIWNLAGANAYWFNVVGLLLAAIAAGYFSMTAFVSILGCLVFMCLVRLGLKVYYGKKL
jgi:hypothetical protein